MKCNFYANFQEAFTSIYMYTAILITGASITSCPYTAMCTTQVDLLVTLAGSYLITSIDNYIIKKISIQDYKEKCCIC